MNRLRCLPYVLVNEKVNQLIEFNSQLKEMIKQRVFAMGAGLFGMADLKEARQYIKDHYGNTVAAYPGAVSMGVFFPTKIIDLLETGPQQIYSYYYQVINNKLDELALVVSNLLCQNGYSVYPIPASQQLLHNRYKSSFSHKLAASMAGLGWIGKSCCLINERVGPRLRLVTVLTNAPLEPDKPVANKCGKCTACVDACPPGAIKGLSFQPEQPLMDRFDPVACDDYFTMLSEQYGIGSCGKCLAACPWGKEKKEAGW